MTRRPAPWHAMRVVLRDYLTNGTPIGPSMRRGLWAYGLVDDDGCVTDLVPEFLEFGPYVLDTDLPFGWPDRVGSPLLDGPAGAPEDS